MYSNDPHYQKLIAIVVEILAQANAVDPPGQLWPDPAEPPETANREARERRVKSPVPDPVPLIVQPCEEVQ